MLLNFWKWCAMIKFRCYNEFGYKFNLILIITECIGGNSYEWNGEC